MKARLEAVIYAAEEPVTLQQLTTLFAEEAFAWKAEREAALAAESQPSATDDAPAAVELAESGRESGAELSDLLLVPERETTPENVESTETAPQTEAEVAAENISEAGKTEENKEDPALEAKRAERRREREVRDILREILDELTADYATDGRGIEIREIAGGFRMGTKPEMHDSVRAFVKSLKPPMKLSLPALETLAVIAYKQPITAPEVGEIRGVDSAGVLGSLMSRKLIGTAGRKQVIGRPMLYKTTKEFLVRFGLKDLTELPSMEEFEKMAAIEMNEDGTEEEVAPPSPAEQSGDLFAEPGDSAAPSAESAPLEAAPAHTQTEAEETRSEEPPVQNMHGTTDAEESVAAVAVEVTDGTEAAHQPESELLPEPAQVEVES